MYGKGGWLTIASAGVSHKKSQMTIDLGLLIGLVSIAVGLFLGLFFGLAGFRKGITSELSAIKETVIAIQATAEKTWDLILRHFPTGGSTIERELENLGKVKITAEPGKDETTYLIEIGKPLLILGMIDRLSKKTGLAKKETEMFGREPRFVILSPTRTRINIPCTEAKLCTEYVTLFLKWLNSTYVESLKDVKDFEEPILT